MGIIMDLSPAQEREFHRVVTTMTEDYAPVFGDPRFLAALEEVRAMHIKKSQDYGSSLSGDPLANIRASTEFGIPGWVGAMVRANDKVHRIKEFSRKGTLANEGVRDSLLDLAAYSLIALVLYDELTDG